MFGYLDFLFLSYSGRIGRTTFWLSLLVLTIIECGALLVLLHVTNDVVVELTNHNDAGVAAEFFTRVVIPSLIIIALFLYPGYAIYTKRWHDRDKSGWWSLIGFVPIIGGLWLTIELGFLGGTPGSNRFGSR
jgi:uncharacterized membrane protein YhaH (DUF805 family)